MLVLNVTIESFFEENNFPVFYSKIVRWDNNGTNEVYNLVKAKLVGQSLVLTKCESLANEYTDDLLAINERETEDDAVSAAVNSI